MAGSNESVKFIRMGCGPSTSGGNRSGRCFRPSASDLWHRLNSCDSALGGFLMTDKDWEEQPTQVWTRKELLYFLSVPLNLYIQTYNSGLYLPQRQERGANRCLRQLQKDRLGANISHPCVRCCGKRGAVFLCASVHGIQRRRCVCVCVCFARKTPSLKKIWFRVFFLQQRAQFAGKTMKSA